MSRFLPTHGFRFLQQNVSKLQELSDDAENGYIFEVDLHYPARLHIRHDDYPLAPESFVTDVLVSKRYFSILHPKGSLLPICVVRSKLS